MNKTIVKTVGIALLVSSASGSAQGQGRKPTAATYITKEEVDTVNKTPGIDRTIRVVDIGDQHFSVGVIHRGIIPAPAPAPSSVAAPAAPAANTKPCGTVDANPAKDLTPGLSHDKQTEGYYIISGEGTLVTGGHVVNGRTEAPDAEVTTTLNGPSCRGGIGGADVVKRFVKTGDIVIIPAGVPHGWAEVKDHVDYVSLRPSSDILTVGYVHPSIKK